MVGITHNGEAPYLSIGTVLAHKVASNWSQFPETPGAA